MNDHFSIQILSEPSFTVFPQDSGSVETLKSYQTTPCLSDLHQTKKVPAVLSMGFFEDNLLYCYITGIKIFRLALLKIFHFENFEFLYKKYLTTEKYFKDLRRCKIEFRTTFVFYTKLIFPLLFELESFENFKKYLE